MTRFSLNSIIIVTELGPMSVLCSRPKMELAKNRVALCLEVITGSAVENMRRLLAEYTQSCIHQSRNQLLL